MVFKPIVKIHGQKQRAIEPPKVVIKKAVASTVAKKATAKAPKRSKQKIKDANRQRILDKVVKGGVCVEIGVWRGNFSKMILDTVHPLNLALIDPWKHFEETAQTEAFAGLTKEDRFEEIFQDVCNKYKKEINSGQVTIIRELSRVAIAQYSDETIDFAYIDGDHSYEGVKADLNDIFPKMKEKGIIAFDDYHRFGWWGDGVLRAIHEFIGQHPTELRVFMVEGAQIALTKLGPVEDAKN
tara:strand:- start:55606 stop:56325 length:720 start_codon:yes stop_codon:yes gene_type:complete